MANQIIIAPLTLILLLTTFGSEAGAQTVKAYVDRNSIHLGETIKFTIQWSGSNPGISINLGVLREDFKVLGTSQSNQINMVEGRTKITTEFMATLQPKRAGKLEIPSFQVGPHQTSPISLSVLPRPQPGRLEDHQDSFL